MSKISEILFGKKGKYKQLKTTTPQQEELMNLILQGLKGGPSPFRDLFGAFNEQDFDKGVTQPALKNFKENILPQITEKFIAGNQARGSGQRNAELKAGVDLQSQLAQLMYEAQQGQQKNRLGGINAALGNKTVENVYQQGKTGIIPGFLQGAGSHLGQLAGSVIAG